LQEKRRIRGLEKILSNMETYNVVREFADKLMQGKPIDMCEICMKIRPYLNIRST
jgi:hypothetical protein